MARGGIPLQQIRLLVKAGERKKEGDQKVKPKKKTAGDIIEPYVRQGLSNSEIAKKTGIKYSTVQMAAKKIRERLAETKGKNADRHLCRTCKYRAATYNQKKFRDQMRIRFKIQNEAYPGM
ncbi:hypothetical protein C808_05355 [Lachnospiraceae bacterium M18-1]|nr:hypothetical protein C808_05355 [Lachnospiraceae bacterium M18-1]